VAYVVVARWLAREGEEDAVPEAIKNMLGPTRAEPGVLFYQPHRDPDNPCLFVLYEQYVDEAAYAAHAESKHAKRFGFGDAIPRLEKREREVYVTWDP
jgi:quinol monooxygenase YgiN